MQKKKVIAVTGPTASGKTALAVELAKRLDGEVISCDSMQVYRKMDIGTAKVTKDEMQGIPHHLIDIAEPTENFSCADYTELAVKAADDIISRGKTPIFCGGTGLYLDSVLTATKLSDACADQELRDSLQKLSPDELHARLTKLDPISAETIHKNNVKRVIRALEICLLTGRPKSEWDLLSRTEGRRYDDTVLLLDFKNRDMLYERIDKRVDIMINEGLLGEVKSLNYPEFRASTASQAIGYKEILAYFDGLCTLDKAINEIKQGSRNYAKRQLTWFRRNKDAHRIFPEEAPNGTDIFEFIVNSALKVLNI